MEPPIEIPSGIVKLLTVGYRVPKRGELYLSPNGKINRLRQDRVQSKRAKRRLVFREVLVENWEVELAKIQYGNRGTKS